jgi:hypothetical protein
MGYPLRGRDNLSKNKKSRNGQPADIVKLTVYDWYGDVIHRVKGKSNEKKIGFAILDVVKDLFGINMAEFQSIMDGSMKHEKKMQESKEIEEAKERLRKQVKEPLKWKHRGGFT